MNDKKNLHLTTEIFKDRESAEKAYQAAIDEGYMPHDINVIMSEDSRNEYYDSVLVKEGSKVSEGLAIGSATGGAIVGIVAAIAAIGTSLVIPGLNLIIAGPLAAGLAGAGAGSIAGGMVGALVGWGIPEDKAKAFESGIKSGGIVLGIHHPSPQNKLAATWKNYNI
jgi:hypothetical protein